MGSWRASLLKLIMFGVISLYSLGETCSSQVVSDFRPTSQLQDQRALAADTLRKGQPVRRKLQAGTTHRFIIRLTQDQFIHVLVTAPDIELLVTVKGPDGETITRVDTSDGISSGRSVFLIAGNDGDYLFEISAKQSAAQPGTYTLEAVELRAASPGDQAVVAAQATQQHGDELRRNQTNDSLKEAVLQYDKSAQLWQASGRTQQEIQALISLSEGLSDIGENRKALDTLAKALAMTMADDPVSKAQILLSRGGVYNALSENEKALDDLNHALSVMSAAQDLRGQSTAQESIGGVLETQSQYTKALEYFDEALALRRRLGDQKLQAESISEIGVISYYLDDDRKALEYYGQALTLTRAVRDKSGEAHVLHDIGLAHQDLGEMQDAIEYLTQALALKRMLGDRRGEANTLDGIGMLDRILGENQKALDYLSRSLVLRRAVGDRDGEAITLVNLGSVYLMLGDRQRAIDYYHQGLALDRTTGDRLQEGVALNNIGLAYFQLGNNKRALEYHDQALTVRRAISARAETAMSLNNAAEVYEALGDKHRAYAMLEEARTTFTELNNRRWLAMTLKNLGELQAALGELGAGRASEEKAVDLAEAVQDTRIQAAALYELARIERRLGDTQSAWTHIEASITIVESTRQEIVNPDLRASYFSTEQLPFAFCTDLLMEMHEQQPNKGYDRKALEVAERFKARSLLDLLNESRADVRQGVDEQLLKQEHSLQASIDGKAFRYQMVLRGKHTEQQAASAKEELDGVLGEYQAIEAEIRAKSPRYAALTQPRSLDATQIQQLLDPDTLLLEYAFGSERGFLWAVTPSSIQSFVLPHKKQIKYLVEQIHKETSTRATLSRTSAALGSILLQPIASQIERKRLVVVPSDALQFVSFAALPLPAASRNSSAARRPLIIDHEIVTVPSASMISVLREEEGAREPAPKTLAVLADPVYEKNDPRVRPQVPSKESQLAGTAPHSKSLSAASHLRDCAVGFQRLPFSRREGDAILALVSPKEEMRAYDFDASRQIATGNALSQYKYVHFASHACVNSEHPELSALVLSQVNYWGDSQDGFLHLHEVYNLQLNADLVVLSACETGLGADVSGEGLVGLTRGFMYAGARQVIVSLWEINDEATADLMKVFYQEMLVHRLRPAAALRAAQLAIWKQSRWRSPYYWAAFVVQGDWR